MKHVIACMRALCPISDETVKELESLVVKCNYPLIPQHYYKIFFLST